MYGHQREFTTFTLKAKSPGSATFDLTLLTFSPPHPYPFLDRPSHWILDQAIPTVEAREFRAEFLQYSGGGFNGPRIIELDGLPPEYPLIAIPPKDTTVRTGLPFELKVTSDGSTPFTYQWKHKGEPIAGATSSTYRVESATAEKSGSYTVTVSDGTRSETSSPAIVTVLPPLVPASTDLWDIAQGGQATRTSGTRGPGTPTSMFGSFGQAGTSQNEYTLFADFMPAGTVHFIEWKSAQPMILQKFHLFAAGDGPTYLNQREFSRFTLLAKSLGSSIFDQVIFSFQPDHPYIWTDPANAALLEEIVHTTAAQEFRAEFTQFNSGWGFEGPRVVELDGLGVFVPGAPIITEQPQSLRVAPGMPVEFRVAANGSSGLSYQWKRNGVALEGATGPVLTISQAASSDVGRYTVEVSNSVATTASMPALLEVADFVAPVVTLEGAGSFTTTLGKVVLKGTATDNVGVARVFWQRTGLGESNLTLAEGKFTTPEIPLVLGLNEIRVVALDAEGNRGEAVARVTLEAARSLVAGGADGVREGTRFSVPITLRRGGGTGGMSFDVLYNPEYLADPQWEWAAEALQGGGQVNAAKAGLIRAAWAFGGGGLPAGDSVLAQVSFRVRSLPGARVLALARAVGGVYGGTGAVLPGVTETISGRVRVVPRLYPGDNNGNGRLDVADAAVILRFITGLEPIRAHDVPGNDLNGNAQIDAGDAVKVLRAVSGADPQPGGGGLLGALAAGSLGASAGARLELATPSGLVRPGDRVTARLDLAGQEGPVAGISFRLRYPPEALRLESMTDLRLGALVPAEAMREWFVAPEGGALAIQEGRIGFAASSAAAWALENGAVAELTFTVQPAATTRAAWTMTASEAEVTDGWDTTGVAGASGRILTGEGPLVDGAELSAALSGGTLELRVAGAPGTRWEVEVSEDLRNWRTLGAGAMDAAGRAVLAAPVSEGSGRGFYRAVRNEQFNE